MKNRKVCRRATKYIITCGIILTMLFAMANIEASADTGRSSYTYMANEYVDTEDETRYGTTGNGVDYAQAPEEHDLVISIPLTDIQAGQYEIRLNYSYKGETTFANLKVAETDEWFAIPGTSAEEWDVFADYSFDQGGFTYTEKAKTYALTNEDTIEIYRGGEWLWIHSVELVPTYTYGAQDFSKAESGSSNAISYVYSEVSQGQLVEIPLTGIKTGTYKIQMEYSYYGEATYAKLAAGQEENWYMIPGTSAEVLDVFGAYEFQGENAAEKTFTLSPDDTLSIYRGGKDDTTDSWIWLHSVTLVPVEPHDLEGDANGNGQVDCADVQLILEYVSGESPVTSEQINSLDQNTDGLLTTIDGALLLQKVLQK